MFDVWGFDWWMSFQLESYQHMGGQQESKLGSLSNDLYGNWNSLFCFYVSKLFHLVYAYGWILV